MKHYILSIFFLGALLCSGELSAQNKCEKKVNAKSAPVITPKGINQKIKVDKKNGQRIFLKKSFVKAKVTPKCMISLSNELNQEVDVYVDGIYMGSIRQNATGVVESLDNYSEVYCISSDKETCWTENGDCNCTYVFNLNKEGK